jgi:hypothetical protein
MTLPGFIDKLIEKDSTMNYYIKIPEYKNVNYSIYPSQLFHSCDWKCFDKCRITCKKLGWSDYQCNVECITACCPKMGPYI